MLFFRKLSVAAVPRGEICVSGSVDEVLLVFLMGWLICDKSEASLGPTVRPVSKEKKDFISSRGARVNIS